MLQSSLGNAFRYAGNRKEQEDRKMKKAVKIAIIGGGSSYTPELMEGFIRRYDQMPVREIWLTDIEEGKEKLDIIGKMAQRMWDATPYDVKIHTTLKRKEALTDADFVTTQIRVGQLNARIKDERIPFSYGMIGQETNGAGGIFKALRTIPVILDIVEDMKKYCPDAWLINFANPSGIVTEAVMRYGRWDRVIGLCNLPIGSIMEEPKLIGKKPEELIFQFAGINHFHWHRVTDRYGHDVTRNIIEKLCEMDGGQKSWKKDLLIESGLLPCSYHRYYYDSEKMLSDQLRDYASSKGTRAQQVQQVEHELMEMYKDPDLNVKPKQLEQRGGAHYSDAACETIVGIYANNYERMVVSTRNNGALPDFPDDFVVEVSSFLSGKGPLPVSFGHLPVFERGLLQMMKSMEQLTIEAAVTGSYGKLLQAFTINPLITPGETAVRVMNELLLAHRKYLPQFKEKIEELEAEGLTIRDDVARSLYEKGL